jgi:hypothetical protein
MNLNVKHKITNIPKKENFLDFDLGKEFLDKTLRTKNMTHRNKTNKQKPVQLYFTKTNTFFYVKDPYSLLRIAEK